VSTVSLGPALLFCPADRPDRYEKAAQRADAVVLDLEDAVGPSDKEVAREALVAHPLDPGTVVVRVNGVRSGELEADLSALARTAYRCLLLPNTESADGVAALAGLEVVALVATACGVLSTTEIARCADVTALMWGAEDLVASVGGTSSRHESGSYRDLARQTRTTVLLAAGAHGKAAIDAVHIDLADLDGLRDEAEDAAASGFAATACLHPDQVPVIRAAYRPSEAQIVWAEQVVAAAAARAGVFQLDGQMIDEPLVAHARRVLTRR